MGTSTLLGGQHPRNFWSLSYIAGRLSNIDIGGFRAEALFKKLTPPPAPLRLLMRKFPVMILTYHDAIDR